MSMFGILLNSGVLDPLSNLMESRPKPREQWTKDEKRAANYNSKAINAIFNGVSPSVFHMVFPCVSAKQAWDILQTTMIVL